MITQRQAEFRQEYRSRIVGWYDGYFHIFIIYAMGAAAFFIYVEHLHDVTPIEWLTVPLTFLFTNAFEWAVHRYVMHRPVNIKGLRAIYERHTLNHHQFFTDEEMRFRDRHEYEHDQRVGREHSYAPILVIPKPHFLVGEELVMIERVALIDGTQPFDVHRTVHDVSVDGPLERIREQESQRDCKPLDRCHIVEMLDIDKKSRGSHRVDDENMKVAVGPPNDAGSVLLPEFGLPLSDHGLTSPDRFRATGDIIPPRCATHR